MQKLILFLTLIFFLAPIWAKKPVSKPQKSPQQPASSTVQKETQQSASSSTKNTSSQQVPQQSVSAEPDQHSANTITALSVFQKAYPDIQFTAEYKADYDDYLITITAGKKTAKLFWCEGRFLPESELKNAGKYWPILYNYSRTIPDPKDFTPEDIAKIKEFSSPQNRKSGPMTPPFFYDVIYDCKTRVAIEQHIVKISFLGKSTNVHKKIVEPLKRVEAKIKELSQTDSEVKTFMDTLLSCDCYNWREISDSRNRSFHSMGIALDILPRGWGQKNVYWAWRRDLEPDTWMLLPLERRWMPPEPVIDAFESEGFIYGGKWIIWDNMHFEYHPEVFVEQ